MQLQKKTPSFRLHAGYGFAVCKQQEVLSQPGLLHELWSWAATEVQISPQAAEGCMLLLEGLSVCWHPDRGAFNRGNL